MDPRRSVPPWLGISIARSSLGTNINADGGLRICWGITMRSLTEFLSRCSAGRACTVLHFVSPRTRKHIGEKGDGGARQGW